jgi:hypothetical protein
MLRFDDVVLARPVPLEGEVKDRESMQQACEKLDTLPIYAGLKHRNVDQQGGIDQAIGRARHLHYDAERDAVVGDVELDMLPEEMAKLGRIGWSMWYHTAEQDHGASTTLLKDIMWKHVLATPDPLDKALETRLHEGYLVGESRDVTPPVTASTEPVKSVAQPTTTRSDMSEPAPEAPPDKPPEESPKEPKAPPKEPIRPEAPVDDKRRKVIDFYRKRLKDKLPDAALKAMNLDALEATFDHYEKEDAEAAKQAEPEHPQEGRRGLPKPVSPDTPLVKLETTEGGYTTIPGFVDKISQKFEFKPDSPFIPLTGPVGQYGNVDAGVTKAQRKKLARESQAK